jgi:hypothetical protein
MERAPYLAEFSGFSSVFRELLNYTCKKVVGMICPMPFEYDPDRRTKRRTRHGIDFDEAQAVWDGDRIP